MGDIINISDHQGPEEVEPFYVTMKDEEGNDFQVMVLDMFDFEYNGETHTYVVLMKEDEQDNSLVVTRYEVLEDESEVHFLTIENEDEFAAVVKWMQENSEA